MEGRQEREEGMTPSKQAGLPGRKEGHSDTKMGAAWRGLGWKGPGQQTEEGEVSGFSLVSKDGRAMVPGFPSLAE